MFDLSSIPIDTGFLKKDMTSFRAGAVVCFEGRVRDHNHQSDVLFLEYEAFSALARSEGEKILAEAVKRFSVIQASCVHRTGRLQVGETAVWIGVLSAHRQAGFDACRYIIDEIKHRLPVWKKEHYPDGVSDWVTCPCVRFEDRSGGQETEFHPEERDYYDRQLLLRPVGLQGQMTLRQSRVLVIGAGGSGSAALSSLAQAGIGEIGICDPDRLEMSNLHRQCLYSARDIGRPKARLAAARLKDMNPWIRIRTFAESLTDNNAESLLKDFSVILDCTDNFEAKFLIHDTAFQMQKRLVEAAVFQFEGHLRSFDFSHEEPCLHCLSADGRTGAEPCSPSGIMGYVPQIMGRLQATEAVKALCALPGRLERQTLIFDFETYQTHRLRHAFDPHCPFCAKNVQPGSSCSSADPFHAGCLSDKRRFGE